MVDVNKYLITLFKFNVHIKFYPVCAKKMCYNYYSKECYSKEIYFEAFLPVTSFSSIIKVYYLNYL